MKVTPDAAKFNELLSAILKNNPGTSRRKAMEGAWGVVYQTAEKLLKGESVNESVIVDIAKKIKMLPSDLITSTEVRKLPPKAAFYTELKFGYFIDQPRTATDVDAKWNREQISLQHESSGGGWSWFTGTIANKKHGNFTVRACLIHKTSFAILASNNQREDSFVASFSCLTHQLNDPSNEVICGVWSGRDHLSRLAVYRMFCSIKQLSQDQIQELLKITPIMPNFKPVELPAEGRRKKK